MTHSNVKIIVKLHCFKVKYYLLKNLTKQTKQTKQFDDYENTSQKKN